MNIQENSDMRYHPIRHNGELFYFNRNGKAYPKAFGDYSPEKYSSERMQAAREAALNDFKQKRKEAAAKATKTRKRRSEANYYNIAAQLLTGIKIGPRTSCAVCKKTLTDSPSIKRGIGPECWCRIISIQTRLQAAGKNEQAPAPAP
jgi:hypothetical protein